MSWDRRERDLGGEVWGGWGAAGADTCFDIPSGSIPDRGTGGKPAPVTPQDRQSRSEAVGQDSCDCDACRPYSRYVGIGNPPHGWFRLAQINLATSEDRYLWCCVKCHVTIYDTGTWEYLNMHRCSVWEPRKLRQGGI